MLKKVEAKCKRCKKDFYKKRTEQEFCSAQCWNAAWKKPRKRRLQGYPIPRGSVANGPFCSSKSVACEPPFTPDLGAFVRGQIERQREQSNPIGFSFPDASKGRVWLASDRHGAKLIGDDRRWRVNVTDLLKLGREKHPPTLWRPTAKTLRRPIVVVGRNDPIQNTDDAFQALKGFKVRIYIEGEKELQALGCGWRIVTVQLRGKNVLLHHNGNKATMKRPAFKALIAANKRLSRNLS
jgi:hypothetical protein